MNKSSKLGLSCLAVILTSSIVLGQPSRVTIPDDQAQELMEKVSIAERMIAARERPGRTYDPSYRKTLLYKLIAKPLEELKSAEFEGGIFAMAVGDSSADLVYTTFAEPCRIIDTRAVGAGGILVAGAERHFLVAGDSGFDSQGGNTDGCKVPLGPATAVVINFVAVNPTAGGNLRGSAWPNPVPPIGSILNYQLLTPNLNIANGIPFPICDEATPANCFTGNDITVLANGGNVHLVADVVGYFSRFPKEQVKPFVVSNQGYPGLPVGTTCADAPGATVSLAAPVDGTVVVRGNVFVQLDHTSHPTDTPGFEFFLEMTPDTCSLLTVFGQDRGTVFEASTLPTGRYFRHVPLQKAFAVAGGSTTTFRINAQKGGPGPSTAQVYAFGLIAEFIPD